MSSVGRCRNVKFFWLAAVVLLFGSTTSHAAPPRFSFFGRKSNTTAPSSDSSWSSFLTVDPSKILAILIQRGGLVLPKSIQEELLAIVKVCHVDEVQWNPVQKRILFTNFTVSLPGMQQHSLRVGRVFVGWESYTKPCLSIEIDDVDVLLEFTNLLLTKTNWNELQDAGFPPAMIAETGGDEQSAPSTASSFVRIGSMDLSGTLRIFIRSRPLDQELCPPWEVDLDTFDEWNTELQRLSNRNLVETGRRGCTTTQLYDWIEKYISAKVRSIVTSTAYDLASQPFAEDDTETVRKAKGFLNQAKNSAWSYARQASSKSGKDLQDNVMGRLETMGIKDKVVATVSKLTLDENTTIEDGENMERIVSAYQALRDAATAKLGQVKGELKALEEVDVGQPEEIFPAADQ